MSCYEWSQGTIILPSASFSPFRKAVQEAMHKKWKQSFDISQKFWQSLSIRQKSDWNEFRIALNSSGIVDLDTMWLIDPMGKEQKPRRVQQSNVNWPNNRMMNFHDSDLSLSFIRETRTVEFSVSENNHAREHADATVLAGAFYDQIARVRWTHGTGGVILGNDEYNRDSQDGSLFSQRSRLDGREQLQPREHPRALRDCDEQEGSTCS